MPPKHQGGDVLSDLLVALTDPDRWWWLLRLATRVTGEKNDTLDLGLASVTDGTSWTVETGRVGAP